MCVSTIDIDIDILYWLKYIRMLIVTMTQVGCEYTE